MRTKTGSLGLALGLVALWAATLPQAANAADANFNGASANGSVVVFSTVDRLVPGDTDNRRDIYERSYDSDVGDYVTREVSTGPTGGNDAYDATYQGISANGGEVFFSTAESLVAADKDRSVDVFARNLDTGQTALVSAAAAGCTGGPCGNGTAEATFKGEGAGGLKVFFETSEGLAPGDDDEAADVYMRDLSTEPPTTVLVSQAASSCSGSCGGGTAGETFVGASGDGQTVFFETTESLSSADGDPSSDIYVRDLSTGSPTTTLVSVAGVCPAGVGASECRPKFRGASVDGLRAFFTTSEQLAGDGDGEPDVYVWEGGAIALVSLGPAGGDGGDPAIFKGATPDGETVFFQTSEKLTGEDEDGAADVYSRDLTAETTALVSQGDPTCAGAGACGAGPLPATFVGATPDGGAVFFQTAEVLSPADADSFSDVYARDPAGTTARVSQPAAACEGGACGAAADATFAAASTDGESVVFTTAAPLVPTDEDEEEDVYSRDLGTGTTTLESRPGICPLPEERGCDATFAAASEDASRVFFGTTERLGSEDVDSSLDVYERAAGETHLVSTGNSVNLGPSTPVLSGTSPAGRGETTTPTVLGRADPNSAIKVYTTADCSGEVVAGDAAELEAGGIPVTVAAGATTMFRATATDQNGDTSGCSNAVEYRQEASPPPPDEEPGGGSGEGPGAGGGGGGSPGGGAGGAGGGASGPAQPSGAGPTPLRPSGEPYVTPVTRITFGPAFKTRARRPVFRFADTTGQPGTSFICRLDRRRWRPCQSPLRLSHLGPGRHVFRVKAVNAVGVWEAKPTARAFKLVRRGRAHGRHLRRAGRGRR